LIATTLIVVAIGAALPQTSAAGALGFAPLPPAYFAFLTGVVATYLVIVEIVKRRVMQRLLPEAVAPGR
jgi:Mg2+-importing ATPase